MPTMSSYRHGVPNWIDVALPDAAAGVAFYRSLFGWDTIDLGPEAGGYGFFTKNGLQVAGFGPHQEGQGPPSWTTYIAVDDVDAAAQRVTANGGTVLFPPMDLPNDSGRMTMVFDSVGAAVGLYQARQHVGAQIVNEADTLAWNELTTRDPDTAAKFYGEVVGWTTTLMEGDFPYRLFHVGSRVVAGGMPMGDEFPPEVPSHWMVYFAVDDVDGKAARVSELGGQVCVPATDMTVGRFAVVADPGGAMFSIITFSGPMDDPNAW